MSTLIVTGAAGLIGSEAVRRFHASGWDVVGIDNDLRQEFFGPEASTRWMADRLQRDLHGYRHEPIDIRDEAAVDRVFATFGRDVELIIHTAAQPSHDWAARQPLTDFRVNALGTLVLLEAARRHAPQATFIFTSTNKVYGDTPNTLPLVEQATRYELPADHPWYGGIPVDMSIDRSTHSLFGVSKAAADLLVQEYGRYFGMRTVTFRGGCLTGPGHSGTALHGFLAYLMRCTAMGIAYTVFGYGGKQVRDNIHSADMVAAFEHAAAAPRPGSVYNIGGGRFSNCSMLEAIALCEQIADRTLHYTYDERPRTGDHQWWISDLSEFQRDYPHWSAKHDVRSILQDIYDNNIFRWRSKSGQLRAAAITK